MIAAVAHGVLGSARHCLAVTRVRRVTRRRAKTRVRPIASVRLGGRLDGRVTDMRRDGLAATVVPALSYPATQIDEARTSWVVGNRRGLGYRIDVDCDHAGPAADHRLDDDLLTRPL